MAADRRSFRLAFFGDAALNFDFALSLRQTVAVQLTPNYTLHEIYLTNWNSIFNCIICSELVGSSPGSRGTEGPS